MLLQMALLHSFLWLSNILLHIYTTFSLPIPLSMDTLVASMLAFVNSAAVHIAVHVSLLIVFFSRYMSRSGLAGSYGSSKSQSVHRATSSNHGGKRMPKESCCTNIAGVFCKFSSLPSPKALVSLYVIHCNGEWKMPRLFRNIRSLTSNQQYYKSRELVGIR